MQQDEKQRGGSIALLKEVTEHMRASGVRRVWMKRDALELEVELDPAAQYLGKDEPEEPAGENLEEKRAKGLCVASGCDKKGGHMGQPYCRQHFLAEMNGAQTS